MAKLGKKPRKANQKSTKGIKKAWKKGHSCTYNPTFNKFRMEAKKRAVFGNQGEGSLTEAKLAQHNKVNNENEFDIDGDATSIGGDTAISAFTNCSLPTFNRFIQNWNSGSVLHKNMMAILAAVSDILKTKGGKETETEYFAALMTVLGAVETVEEVTAVVCLLSIVVKRLHESILKLEFEKCCSVYSKLLIKYMNSDYCALLRNLLKVVYYFMKVKSKWSESTVEYFKILLEFATHQKPKVRKSAQQIIKSLVNDCSGELAELHPGKTVLANFCIRKVEKCAGSKELFYILALLEDTLAAFSKSGIKLLCETILRVMTLSNSMVTSVCLKTIKGLFEMKPSADNLPCDLNARIITALYDYQPNAKEGLSLIYWIQVMEAALVNLKEFDDELCYGHLLKFYHAAVKLWQSDNEEVLPAVALTLNNLLHACIDPETEVFQNLMKRDPKNNSVMKMFHCIEEGLGYSYHKAWKYVLIVITAFFEVIGKHCSSEMLKCLQSLAEMHDSYKFPHLHLLEKAIGTAVEHLGPQVVLKAIPLQINYQSETPSFPRSWLLPLLRDNIKRTELDFFIKYFMPLAADIKNKIVVLQQEKRIVESKLYEVICSQIWSLLPGFCTEPTDLKRSFSNFAKTLGMLLNEEPSLRITVLSSLRLLISKNLENEEKKAEIARFSKNYLPILFNLYTTQTKDKSDEGVRLAVYDTAKVFLQITNKELCQTFFQKALTKLHSCKESDDFTLHSLLDICRAILPYIDTAGIQELYEYCKPLLMSENHTTQKKSYSVLNELCNCSSDVALSFVKGHLAELKSLLCGTTAGLRPSTRALRLNILGSIITQLSEDEKEFVATVVPEVVLSTKENSVKARFAAFNLLVTIGNALLQWQSGKKNMAMYEYIKFLLAGLAGSPHLISASVLAIGRVLFEFKDEMDANLINLLVENMCILLSSKSREVVTSVLSFLKILLTSLDTSYLAQHVEYMVKHLTSISEENQRHFRFKAKQLLTRLVRKFGYEMIKKMVPESHQKQLKNIHVLETRKARKKTMMNDSDEEEIEHIPKDGLDAILADSDDDMVEVSEPSKPSRKRSKNSVMIEEHGEDDIVDFMDPSVSRKLLSAKPQKISKIKSTKCQFPISEDGRLIITENDDIDAEQTDQMNEKNEALEEIGAIKKKKKRKLEESDDDEEEEGKVGKGIHRSLNSDGNKKFGSAYKAKNAGGDVKKGKFEPYAYVPLNKQFLNKRKQIKMKGQFKNMVKGAKKGATSGVKRKMRDARRRKNKS